MVVQGHITHQGLLHVQRPVEAMRLEDIRNAAIETLNHAIGLGRSGPGQPMLNAQRSAKLVKLMLATGVTLTAGKQPIRELLGRCP